jgi:hypothetical protein
MHRRISPSCLNGYDVICCGVGQMERNAAGRQGGIPEPVLSHCIASKGLCWWIQPIGFSFSITLPVDQLSAFWTKDP